MKRILALFLAAALPACGGFVWVETERERPVLDSDGDGLSDRSEELDYFTDPFHDDSDGDGLYDGEEVLELFTDPLAFDTDADGLSDSEEVFYTFTDPNYWDTDGDGWSDSFEVRVGTDPLLAYY